ncbi:transposase [Nitrosomonas oligotropha]|uniref:REP element-mobilizing transposase RayT n=1 Tax=Nitrosomonas oligotropha TaxID=42354 RepID=A0A1H8TVJ1_9PROT|nr:transposase [Nitrosomonas oligotropha]SDX35990.1 REP element-mobilizing transposase RayT [Nitrosomonas oligotropha]SEO94614.1 REP element-mobilizing transposase RayT [Nitrosomonas oligotropha]
MTFNPNLHRRRSIRLQGYDYSQAGAYFITICTHDRMPLFGEIVDGVMTLNAAGNIVSEEWQKTGQIRHQIALHEFVIMPNHIHGIIQLVGADCTHPDCIGPNCTRPDEMRADSDEQPARIQPGRVQRAPTVPSPTSIIQPAPTVGDVVRGFKSSVTKRVNALPGVSGQRIWQRNYYEHIIRNENAYLKIAEYIQTNPQRWEMDTYYV